MNSICNRSIPDSYPIKVSLLTIVLLLPCQVNAWDIEPNQLELSVGQPIAAVTIRNTAEAPVTIQIQAVSWTQNEGKDLYSASRELIASPGMVTVAAHAEQLIRVGLRRKADSDVELAYRLNFQELPAQTTAELPVTKAMLRIGMPVFVQPNTGNPVIKTRWNMLRLSDKDLKISVLNQSNRHVKVLDFSVYGKTPDSPLAGMSGVSYVLPDQTHAWTLKIKSPDKLSNEPLRVKAYTDAGVIETELLSD
jgi:fimbrial chaperone protein